jgi:hypothetical protein
MTRANTERPHTSGRTSHPKAGGEHSDALEHGMPTDRHSAGAGTANAGTGVKPSSSPNHLEHADYPEPGEQTAGGGGHNHRILPTPSKEAAGPIGDRSVGNASGVIGGGRGSSGKFRGTMGDGAGPGEPKYKGTMGC